MGINERDYIRRAPPRRGSYGRGGLSGWRSWSVNTWLIVICVAVFFLDGFTGMRFVEISAPALFPGVSQLPETWTVAGPAKRLPVPTIGGDETEEALARAVLDRPEGQQIGLIKVAPMHVIESYLHFSTDRGFFKIEFWRLIGFQFLHSHQTLMHLVFNMLGLFFFGSIVERYLGSKRYLAFYLLCGVFGALMYVALNLGGVAIAALTESRVRIPGLLFEDLGTPLIGASAGVFGVLMAGAFLVPNATVLLFFIIPMRLVTLAYALVFIALFTVIFGGSNAGGEAGHLGGAIAGYYFIRHPHHLHGFFDFVGRLDPTSHHYRGKFKGKGFSARDPKRSEIDRILDKISTKGIQSLTDREKSILRKQSE